MEDVSLLQIIETGGTVAVLGLMLIAFIKGWIWPAEHVTKALEAQRQTAEMNAEILASKVVEGMESAISKAIVQGVAEARRQNGERK